MNSFAIENVGLDDHYDQLILSEKGYAKATQKLCVQRHTLKKDV